MRLLILSDLHHELWHQDAPVIDPAISKPDVVILAGDIDIGARAVAWAAKTFVHVPVLYVHGNHESYGENLEDMQRDIAAACRATDNVHFLNCSEYVLGSVRFLGATLWTDFKLFGDDASQASMRAAEAVLADYRRIRLADKGFRYLLAADTSLIHSRQRLWLQNKLAEPFDGKTVVITHMAPSMQSLAERYATDPVSAGFASNLDRLVAQANLWVHGHMHDSFDYRVGQGRVVCNPCGYITFAGHPENDQFDPNFIV
ncbi:MAG: metallophosphoesterase, partial [Burkholderiaceae bacterium]